MKILVLFSGGKDSLASLIYAVKKYGAKNITAVFCDTGWEHEITYKHIKEVCEKIGVELVVLKSSKYKNFVDLAKKKKRFPSTKARFCTEELKTKPMIDYVLSLKEHLLIIQGIRKDESQSRSKMEKQCTYFKYYYEPYKITGRYDKLIKQAEEFIESGEKIIPDKLSVALHKISPNDFFESQINKAKELNQLPENRIKHYHTYRKKEILEWRQKYNDDIDRPVFDWTAQQTIDYIISNGFTPNPLYYKGFARVGCMPCIMCRLQEIKSMKEFLPDAVARLKKAEKKVNSSLFPPDYIPKRFCSGKDKNGKKFPTADDVLNYVGRNDAQQDLFREENVEHRCMSFYGICE